MTSLGALASVLVESCSSGVTQCPHLLENLTCEWTCGLQPSRILYGLLGCTPVRLDPLQGLQVAWRGDRYLQPWV